MMICYVIDANRYDDGMDEHKEWVWLAYPATVPVHVSIHVPSLQVPALQMYFL